MTLHPPSDRDLLAGGVEDLVTENATAARRLGRLVEFHRRCGHRVAPEGHFTLTPVQETVVEVGELWGQLAGKSFSSQPHDFIADGDKVVVLTTVTLEGETSESADVLTYNGEGKLIAFDTLGDPAAGNRVFPK